MILSRPQLVKRLERLPGDRLPTPIWLTDTDYPAPCFCGQPMLEDEPMMLAMDDRGLKRMIHLRCISPDMLEE